MARAHRLALIVAAAVPAAALALAGCGSSSSASTPPAATTAAATTAPATTAPASTAGTTTAPAATSSVTVQADPTGALAFVQTSLTAKAGKSTFVFTNQAPLPHNLTIEKAGTSTVLGATKTIQGATDSLTLDLPAGTYTYFCSVPGHEAAGMKGTLTVS